MAFQRPTEMVVFGSYGTLEVDPQTGAVLAYHPDGNENVYDNVVRCDVDEYFTWVAALAPGAVDDVAVDLLDIGYWQADGTYEPPTYDHRDELFGLSNRPSTDPDDNARLA